MHFKIDGYCGGEGYLQKLSPTVKLVALCGVPFVASVIAPSRPAGLCILLAASFAALYHSMIPSRVYFGRLAPLAPFLAYAAAVLAYGAATGRGLFMENGPSGRTVSLPGSVELGFATSEQLFVSALLLKTAISYNAAIAVTATTRFADIVAAMRSFRFPAYAAGLFAATWRYLEAIVNEAMSMRTAATARLFSPRDLAAAPVFARMFTGLLMRVSRRAEMNALSMRLRMSHAAPAASRPGSMAGASGDIAFSAILLAVSAVSVAI